MDARIVDKVRRRITLLEIGCPWAENRQQKDKEKTLKYAPLRMELKGQQPGFEIKQVNIVINSLGGYSKGLRDNMRSIVAEERGKHTLRLIQKAVLTSSLSITRLCKISC